METRLKQALAQQKQMYARLEETLELTRQLAEAVDRDDQVSVRMLLSMRHQPVAQLMDLQRSLRQLRQEPPAQEGERLAEILNGTAPETDETMPLSRQCATNRRLTEQLLALDRSVNRKLGRERSFYDQEADAPSSDGAPSA